MFIFELFTFLTFMIDNKAVDLKEERMRLEREGLSMVPTNLSSKSQWTNKTNNTSYNMNNSAQRNVSNPTANEDYQQFHFTYTFTRV